MSKERLEEIWKRINGYEEYEISNLGRVKSFKHDRKGKIMKPKFSGEYLAVTLCADGQQERKTIHRLVAEHFIPNPSGLPWVNHKDGNKLNNKVTNLEWVTPSENNNHAYKIGLKKGVKGEKHGRSKLNEIDVITIYHLAKSEVIPIKKIANKFGVTFQTVSDIKLEKRWKHLTNPQAERVQELGKLSDNLKHELFSVRIERDLLKEEVKALKKSVNFLEKQRERMGNNHQQTIKDAGLLLKQNQRYKQALGFYADKENYKPFDGIFLSRYQNKVDEDGGEKARQALEGEK